MNGNDTEKHKSVDFGQGEEDPSGIGQHQHGAKTDKDKPDLSLLLMFGKALRAVGGVGTHGARKYTRGGWQGVSDGINRYTAALLRHLLDEHYEVFDKDLPVMHAAQVAWNALARLELMLRSKNSPEEADLYGEQEVEPGGIVLVDSLIDYARKRRNDE